ncbi:ABC transporter substrate-binding protein [Arthrobacter sp.]|uniref:ABC transporter substrate-binding protein n=1 Tax=Arthrobacter sp. TaxID=1667 RepID=UPI003A9306D4
MMKLRSATVGLGLAAMLLLSGCGGGSPSGAADTGSSAGGGGDLTPVTVGVLSIAPSVAMQYGIDEGIFEKHGLKVELQTGQGGAAMLPAVSTGTMDFAVGNPLSVLTAADKGLDMRIVTGYSNSKAEGDDINGVVTRKDSGIDGFADLAGKTTSVNALKTQGDLTIMDSAAQDGADASQLKFNEMGFQDMEAQLERGNTDAIWVPEPFLSRALADKDNKLVGYPNQVAIPGLPTMVTFTSGTYADGQKEVVTKFRDAMTDTLSAAEANQDDAKALLPDFMGMDAKVAKGLKMETWDAEVPRGQLEKLGELTVEYDFLSKQPDLDKIVVQ